ncbi:MAG: sigma-70 family RNA polymerase sigma factor [Clostridia bacterium]|nr:sigma-70 family RNA polymerase sigma factor [Clostridia bacterium]
MMENEAKRKTPYDENPDLVRRYRAGDAEAGELLVERNLPLVYSIAARFRERAADSSDLIECGTMGLVKAIKTFDTERGCAFSTYAVPLIFGEIRRFLRDDGFLKVSREEKKLSAILNRERERRMDSGEPYDLSSLAAAVGISLQDAASALFSEAPVRSLDESVFDDDGRTTLGSTLFNEDEECAAFDKLALHAAIEKLDAVRRKLIILRYFRDFSQVETARALGLSQVKVSREEKKIMEELRAELS